MPHIRGYNAIMPGGRLKSNARPGPGAANSDFGQILDSRGSRTYQLGVLFGLVIGAVLLLVGVALCIAGISGSIDWVVSGKGWGSKLMNASPGVFFSLLGFLIIIWYKPKYQFSFNTTSQGAAAGKGGGKTAVTKIQGSGQMSALPDPKDGAAK